MSDPMTGSPTGKGNFTNSTTEVGIGSEGLTVGLGDADGVTPPQAETMAVIEATNPTTPDALMSSQPHPLRSRARTVILLTANLLVIQ